MEKTVTAGMRNTTVTLDGTECAVKFSDNYRCFEMLNDGDGDVTMSIYKGKKAGEDGVMTVHSGMSATVAHMRTDIDTVYITGSGTVQVAAKNAAEPVFKVRAKGGDGNFKLGGLIEHAPGDSGWKIGINGSAIRETGEHVITYYPVAENLSIYVKAADDRNECKFVWSDRADVASAYPNPYMIGAPVTNAVDGFVTVPKGAKYICFSQYADDTETGVYAVRM